MLALRARNQYGHNENRRTGGRPHATPRVNVFPPQRTDRLPSAPLLHLLLFRCHPSPHQFPACPPDLPSRLRRRHHPRAREAAETVVALAEIISSSYRPPRRARAHATKNPINHRPSGKRPIIEAKPLSVSCKTDGFSTSPTATSRLQINGTDLWHRQPQPFNSISHTTNVRSSRTVVSSMYWTNIGELPPSLSLSRLPV